LGFAPAPRFVGRVERQRNPTCFGRQVCGAVVGFRSCVAAPNLHALAGGFVESSLGFAPAPQFVGRVERQRNPTCFGRRVSGVVVGFRSCAAVPKYHLSSGLSSWLPEKNLSLQRNRFFTSFRMRTDFRQLERGGFACGRWVSLLRRCTQPTSFGRRVCGAVVGFRSCAAVTRATC